MVYLKYNSVKLPVLDNYNIAKSSQEITFSDLKCDFTGHQKTDLPEKYQEVRVVEESKVNREIEKIEYEEKKDVKELSFESKVKEKISICKVHGYSSQETRSGKNKFDLNSISEDASGTLDIYETGIGATWRNTRYTEKLNMNRIKAGTYKYCFKLSISNSNYADSLVFYDKDNKVYTISLWNNGYETSEITFEKEIVAIQLFINSNKSQGNWFKVENFMLIPIDSTVSTDYEPYGVMPSSEYLSPIQNVGDNINLFDLEDYKKTYGLSITGIDEGHNYIEYTTNQTYKIKYMEGSFKESTQYTLSFYARQKKVAPGTTSGFTMSYTDGTITRIFVNNNEIWTKYTVTSDENKTIDYIRMNYNHTGTIFLSDVKLEKGTKATSYSPYNCGNIDITVCNKNLVPELFFENGSKINTLNGITAQILQDNKIKISGTATERAVIYFKSFNLKFYGKQNYQYISNSIGYDCRIEFKVKVDNKILYLNSYSIPNNNMKCENLLELLDAFIIISKGQTVDNTFYFFIQKENEDTTYIQHQSQTITFPLKEGQKLRSLPNGAKDYLAEDGIHKNVGIIILNGDTNENYFKATDNKFALNVNTEKGLLLKNLKTDNLKISVLSDKFLGVPWDIMRDTKEGWQIALRQDGSYTYLRLLTTGIEDTKALKTFLQNNNAIVAYPLAKEEIVPYTVEQQKAWNNMQNLVSYVGINNINSSTNIDVKYPVRIKKEIVPETYDKLLYTGYIDDYVFDEMRELDEDINISFTLLSPQKIATLRTCIAVGTYEIKDLIENIILAPLIDDGFTLKEINIVNKSLTVNFLVETVEYCMNNLSNKYNFWWYIDENKNIYVKDIETMFKEEPMYIYDDKHTINGLEYVKPITNSYDYANVINFKNVRIYEYSRLRMNKKEVAEAHNPLIDGQVTNIKQNDQITFNFPIDIKKENIIKSANSNGITNTNIIYGIYVEGTYEDNTDFSFFVSFDTLNNLYKISDNLGFDGESTDSEKEFLLMRDSFFSNLITGIKYNNGNKKINSIKAINSDSTLIYNVNKFLNDKGILEKKNIISKTGIVERTIDMKESWKTVQELTEIGASYLNKNSLNYADELEIKLDKDKFQVGKILYINKFMIDGRYVVTEIQRTDQNNDDEFLVKCKNANILDNFIDIFRQENEQTSSDKIYQLYVTHYEEEGISERFEVVQ